MEPSNTLLILLASARFFLLFLAISKPLYGADESMATLFLAVGESLNLMTADSYDLNINRKGIVNAHALSPGKWRLTGLKPGIVMLQCHNQQWLLEVQKDTLDPTDHKPWPSWLCAKEGVRCLSSSQRLEGLTGDFIYFQQAWHWCHDHPPCFFQLFLQAEASKQWQEHLQKLLPPIYHVFLSPQGRPIILSPCHDSSKTITSEERLFIDQLTDELISKNLGVLSCFASYFKSSYLLHAKVLLLSQSQAKELGFHSQLEAELSLPDGGFSARSLASLQALLEEKNIRIIGEPIIRLTSGTPIHVQNGGEFAISSHAFKPMHRKADWKSYGLNFKATATPRPDQTIHLAYSFSLSQPSESQSSIQSNYLQSEIVLPLNQAVLAGMVELANDHGRQRNLDLLSQLPLIGPLFRLSHSQASASKALLWLYIELDNDNKDRLTKKLEVGS